MDKFIIIILIFGIPSFFFSKPIIDYFRNKKLAKKEDGKVTYRYIIQFKEDAIGRVQPKDLKDIGKFDAYGTSGAGLQGVTNLKEAEFKEYLCSNFSISPELVKVINPLQYIGLR